MSETCETVAVLEPTLRGSFVQIPVNILCHPGLSHGAVRAFAVILSFKRQDEFCWPGQSLIAEKMGIKRQAAGRFLKELTAFGLLIVERRGLQQTNRYTIPAFVDIPHLNQPAAPDVAKTVHQDVATSVHPVVAKTELPNVAKPRHNVEAGEVEAIDVEAGAAKTPPPAEITKVCSILGIPENTEELPAILRATSKRPDLANHFEHVADRTRLHYSGWGTFSEGRRVAAFIRFVETQRPPEIHLVDGGGAGGKRGRAEPEPFVPGRGNDKYMDQFRRQAAEQRERAAQRKAEVASAAAG